MSIFGFWCERGLELIIFHLFHHCLSTFLCHKKPFSNKILILVMYPLFIFGGSGSNQTLKFLKNMLTLCLFVKEVIAMFSNPLLFEGGFHHCASNPLILKEVLLNKESSALSTLCLCMFSWRILIGNKVKFFHLSLIKSLEPNSLLLYKALSMVYIPFVKYHYEI